MPLHTSQTRYSYNIYKHTRRQAQFNFSVVFVTHVAPYHVRKLKIIQKESNKMQQRFFSTELQCTKKKAFLYYRKSEMEPLLAAKRNE